MPKEKEDNVFRLQDLRKEVEEEGELCDFVEVMKSFTAIKRQT